MSCWLYDICGDCICENTSAIISMNTHCICRSYFLAIFDNDKLLLICCYDLIKVVLTWSIRDHLEEFYFYQLEQFTLV
jgi:hypothetical protein